MTTVSFAILGFATLLASAVLADGEGCSASEKKNVEGALSKAEQAEKAGRNKDAYQMATGAFGEPGCATNGYKRRDGLIERTSKKLGAEAEKAGQFGDAFKYFSAPHRHGRLDYPLADADRAMLKHAKASPDNYPVVAEAAHYLERREGQPHLKEVLALARSGGDKALAKEEKAYPGRRDTLEDLRKAKEWFGLVGDVKPVYARAVQRGDTLLAENTVRSIELAMQYYQFADNKAKAKQARERAGKLGDEAARKGEHGLAARYYDLSGDQAKMKSVEKQKEKTESRRQDQFKKDQKSLEKELGL
jgi:hypothetical protein